MIHQFTLVDAGFPQLTKCDTSSELNKRTHGDREQRIRLLVQTLCSAVSTSGLISKTRSRWLKVRDWCTLGWTLTR